MKQHLTLFTFLLGVFSLEAQNIRSCAQIESNTDYYSARSTGASEQEAQENAKNLLVQQFSSLVTSRTSMSLTAGNNSSEQQFQNISKTVSNLRLGGLKYMNCNEGYARKNSDKNDGNVSVIAYISKDDLNKSGIKVRENIRQCLELYDISTANEDGMYELYQAYLHTFCTPLSVAGRVGRDSVSNLQVYLENKLREHLSTIRIKCVEALPHPSYPDEQIRLSLKTKGVASTGLTYTINCQSINAQKQLSTDLTAFDVLMLPNAPSEEFSCELVLGCIPFSENNDLNTLSETELITWPVRFSANMQKVISIDFTAKETGNMVKLSPIIEHLSVRTFEWLIDGKKVGSEQNLTIAQNEIASRSVTLRLNNNDSLSVTKTAAEMRIKKTEVISPVKDEKKADSTTLAVRKSNAVKDPMELLNLNDFSSLQMRLDALKKSGKIAVAKKETFINPDKCWVILVDPNDKQVKHCLAPGKEQRIDIKTEQTYVDFESKLKGLIAIWVEVY
jgi:hypothetical protein